MLSVPIWHGSIMPGDTSSPSLFGRMSARSSFISRKDVKVSVQLLDDTETVASEFKRSQTGQDILNYVCECMNLKEKDYFGLRYQDNHKHRYWVDLSQSLSQICKVVKSEGLALRLRFRYYPSDVKHLREELTRYQLFVQLQRDLLHGRLYSPQSTAVQLAAYILQSQLGDYNEETANGDRYVSEFKLLVKQTPKMEAKIAEHHMQLKGMKASEAELEMIKMASQIETYGFDPYTIKESKNSTGTVYIGANHRGVLIYHGNQKMHQIPWNEVAKVDFFGNDVMICPTEGYLAVDDGNNNTTISSNGTARSEKKSGILRYSCPSRTYAKHLWVHILSQKSFFNETSADKIKPLFSRPRVAIFSRGSTFRFPSARVQREIEAAPSVSQPREMTFSRYALPRQTPRPEQSWQLNKYNTLPNLKYNSANSKSNAKDDELTSPGARSLDCDDLLFPRLNTTNQTDSASVWLDGQTISSSAASPPSSEISIPKQNVGEEGDSSVSRVLPPLSTSTPLTGSNKKYRVFSSRDGEAYSIPLVSSILNGLFVSILFLIILVAVFIAVFERQESRWVAESEWLSALKHEVYEPARNALLSRYHNVFS